MSDADKVDEVLDTLEDPTADDVWKATHEFTSRGLASAAAKRAMQDAAGGSIPAGGSTGEVLTKQSNADGDADWEAPAGGSQPGAARWIGPFPFTYDDAGLNDGVEFYTPTVGDWLIDAVIVIAPDPNGTDLPWDGTTPLGDIGWTAAIDGLFALYTGAVDMTNASSSIRGDRLLAQAQSQSRLLSSWLASAGGLSNIDTPPLRFITTDPLSVWVSQDGTAGGTSPGASQGDGAVYLCIATPSAP